MTEVTFHFNAPDKWKHVYRLLRKAALQGSRVAVTGDENLLTQLDVGLWTFSAVDFVAHCADDSDAGMLAASPVVLCKLPDKSPHPHVLLNLGAGVPPGFNRYQCDEKSRVKARRVGFINQSARQRSCGYRIERRIKFAQRLRIACGDRKPRVRRLRKQNQTEEDGKAAQPLHVFGVSARWKEKAGRIAAPAFLITVWVKY